MICFSEERIIFHEDDALARKSILTMAKLKELKYELLEHLLYSSDLAPRLETIRSWKRYSQRWYKTIAGSLG